MLEDDTVKKEIIHGAVIERGKIVSVSNGAYVVESVDRDGITALPSTPIDLETFSVGDLVYFFVHDDGTGRIISGIDGEVNALTQADIVNNAVTDDATKVASAAVAKLLQDQILNIPIKVYKYNYDQNATAANTYETVAMHNVTGGKSYIFFVASFYASGQPTGVKLMYQSSALKTVESSSYHDVYMVYPAFFSSGGTISIQDKRASAGRHTGTVIIFEA